MTPNCTSLELQVAWLHDTIEDTETTVDEIEATFGMRVGCCVLTLTDIEEGNRKTRKALACKRLSAAPSSLQTIKYADGLSNIRSIMVHDRKFAKVYVQEWKDLLNVMNKGDPTLYAMVCREVRQAGAILEMEYND